MYAGNKPLLVQMENVSDVLLGQARPYLYALLGAVAFVLLIACVNVANLLLARGEVRKKELAIRTAMGASRQRLTRQTLTESLVFALVGGALGLAAALGGVRFLVGMAPSDVPRIDDVRVDVPVLLFTFGVAIATGVLFGILPAIRSGRAPAAETLRDGGRTSTGGGRAFRRARRALVISEVALAVVTLTGAGLLLRSLWNLQQIELGIDTENVLTLRVTLPEREYANERATGAVRTLLQQVRALPGVRHAGAVGDLPIADGHSGWSILIDGAPATSVAESPVAAPQQATPGYFAALGIPVLRGRGFTEADDERASLVVVVNETMARERWPGKDAIDGTVAMLGTPAARARVIGVVRDVRSSGFLQRVQPTMYFPHAQAFRSAYYAPAAMNLVVKTSGDPMLVVPAIRRIVRELEPKAPIARLVTMEQVVSESVAARRFATELVAAFAGLAVLLAGIGIYGVISYGVNQRAFEMGLRMALGAQRGQVVRSVLGDAVRTALAGVAIGTALGVALTRLMRSMFVNVEPWDPLTLGTVLVALVGVALLASYFPARRASTVGPARVLRGE
jgi:putative ABC transport system permease protein